MILKWDIFLLSDSEKTNNCDQINKLNRWLKNLIYELKWNHFRYVEWTKISHLFSIFSLKGSAFDF